MKIGILTDSTANLKEFQFERSFVKVIDFSVVIDGVSHSANGLSSETFYAKMAQAKSLPSTSQGSVMNVVSLLEEFEQEGYSDVIVLTISSKLSGSYQNIAVAAKEVTGLHVHMPDSKTTEVMLGATVMEVATMIEADKSLNTILSSLDSMLSRDGALFYVDSLKHLVKGGRISGASGMVGEVLKIKPILGLTGDGTIELQEKKRTKSKALDRLIELYKEAVQDQPHTVYFLYSDNPAEVQAFSETVATPYATRVLKPITPVVGAHTGPGVIGLGWRIEQRA
jgi:DegV family protein with EDD domain